MRPRPITQTTHPPAGASGKTFALAEAGRALVLVRRIVADIVADYARVLECQEILELQQRHGSPAVLAPVQSDMAACVDRIQDCLVELDEIGVAFRDYTRGEVDFPARPAGRSISYSWRLDEPCVEYWRDAEDIWPAGPNDPASPRRPIAELAEALSVS